MGCSGFTALSAGFFLILDVFNYSRCARDAQAVREADNLLKSGGPLPEGVFPAYMWVRIEGKGGSYVKKQMPFVDAVAVAPGSEMTPEIARSITDAVLGTQGSGSFRYPMDPQSRALYNLDGVQHFSTPPTAAQQAALEQQRLFWEPVEPLMQYVHSLQLIIYQEAGHRHLDVRGKNTCTEVRGLIKSPFSMVRFEGHVWPDGEEGASRCVSGVMCCDAGALLFSANLTCYAEDNRPRMVLLPFGQNGHLVPARLYHAGLVTDHPEDVLALHRSTADELPAMPLAHKVERGLTMPWAGDPTAIPPDRQAISGEYFNATVGLDFQPEMSPLACGLLVRWAIEEQCRRATASGAGPSSERN